MFDVVRQLHSVVGFLCFSQLTLQVGERSGKKMVDSGLGYCSVLAALCEVTQDKSTRTGCPSTHWALLQSVAP
jgi:hypothetical protein